MSKPHLSPSLRRIGLEAIILCALAMTVGLSLNYPMVMKAFRGKTVAVQKIVPQEGQKTDPGSVQPLTLLPNPVELDELDELIASGALFVDARSAAAYADGHLPGAVSLPLGAVDQQLPDFLRKVPRDRPIVTYCNGFGCPDSFDLGVHLLREGYIQVLVFEGGFPEWRDAGRPLGKGP